MTDSTSNLKYRDSVLPGGTQRQETLPDRQIPAHQIRVSQRAKHVSIRVSHLGEVEVVIPPGFDPRQVPDILEKRQDWILRTTGRVLAERHAMAQDLEEDLPQRIELRSLLEEWQVDYHETAAPTLTARSRKDHQVIVSGPTRNADACRQVLQRWLSQRAKYGLVPWLQQVSREVDLPCGRITVRGQRSLWASCSNKKNISLNYKLLFLPPDLVRYVFIHELCHTIHLNHSARFWALVEEKEPDYRQLDKDVSKAWRYVPAWVERSLPDRPTVS